MSLRNPLLSVGYFSVELVIPRRRNMSLLPTQDFMPQEIMFCRVEKHVTLAKIAVACVAFISWKNEGKFTDVVVQIVPPIFAVHP
jgi:hypothetical protein